MALREILRFELSYQLRQRTTWIFFLAIGTVAGLFALGNFLPDAVQYQFFVNGPFVISVVTVLSCLVWLLVAPAIAGEAAARDVEARIYPLLYAAPLRKIDYLGGRFLAAFLVNALILLAAQIGILIAVYSPGVPPEVLGPFRPASYLTAFGFLALPNAFCGTAIQFLVASRTGRPRSAYLGSVFLFFASYIVSVALGVLFNRMDLARLLDAMGVVNIVGDASRQWTPAEKSTRLLALQGVVLWNRMIWLGVGFGALAVTFQRFKFAHRSVTAGWWARRRKATVVADSARPAVAVPTVRRSFGFRTRLRQTLAIASTSFRTLLRSPGGIVLFVIVPIITMLVMPDVMQVGDVPMLPVTAKVIHALTAPLTDPQTPWIIVPLLLVLFTGDLIWREREANMADISDATPLADWVPFAGKYLGVALLLVLWRLELVLAGMLSQQILGAAEIDVALYLKSVFALQLPDYLLFALLAFAIHAIVNQKHLGYLVVLLAYGAIMVLPLIGLRHNLVIYTAAPQWSYTEMRGFDNVLPWLWFKLYWSAWALLLAVITRLLWARGRESSVAARFRLAGARSSTATRSTMFLATAAAFGLGGFIFYNTNILNRHETRSSIEARQAEFEQRFGKFRGVPQPRVEAAKLRVEFYPDTRAIEMHATFKLVNRTTVPINSIHLSTSTEAVTDRIETDRAFELAALEPSLGYAIVALEQPLAPGDSVELRFAVSHQPAGFTNGGIESPVVPNGSFLVASDWLPTIGYQWTRELSGTADRRKYGLPPRPGYPSPSDSAARMDLQGGERMTLETVIGTADGQTAVAPGTLLKSWSENGRSYFAYATDGPIRNEFRLTSASYTIAERRWKDVTIQVYHHPSHTANVERMLASAEAALDLHSREFGAYPHRILRFIEHPGYSGTLHSDETAITYEEESSYFDPRNGVDIPYAAVAHEVAHQWWGNRLVPAHVLGAPILSESFAWYTAMLVVEQSKGAEELDRLRRFFRQPNPIAPTRTSPPLLLGLEPYLSYRKGPYALYALRRYIGEAQVNGVLRQLLATHPAGTAPLPTTLDLYRELQAVTPDSLHHLLRDLFEANTLWDLRTHSVSAVPDAAGGWRVTLEVEAYKTTIDLDGKETEIPMNDLIEIGVYSSPDSGRATYLQQHRIHSGKQTITVTVPDKPVSAGIDPEILLLDLNAEDNVQPSTLPN